MMADMACMYYAADFYMKLNGLDKRKLKEIADECSELSLITPLHECHDADFVIKSHDVDYKMTGLQVVALLAVSMDVLSNYQLSNRGMSFGWLISGRQLAEQKEKK